jgi:pimeloyl-ACP methyl ester carboxylesterase
VALDGAPLRGFIGGRTGPETPLVMLHGTALDDATLSFGPVLPRLAARRQLLALDWPGHGGSAPRRFRNLDDEVIFLSRALEAFGIGRADLLGFSMGGSFALAYTLAFPERVRTLTLVSSHGLGRLVLPVAPRIALAGPTPALALALADRLPTLLDSVVRAVVLSGGKLSRSLRRELHERAADPQRRTAFLMWLRRELRPWRYRTDLTPRLRRLRTPTLLIHGRHDLVAPWGRSLRASKRIAQARFRLLDAGHWLPRQQPRQFAKIVERFLNDPQGMIGEV